MKQLGFSTLPASWLYGGILKVRHFLYDHQVVNAKTHENLFTICVGNLSLGGTGKTPTTEFLLSKFHEQYNTGVVSRGYGRKTKGYFRVDAKGTADQYGDEPLQMAQKFPNIPFAVCENRWEGIDQLKKEIPEIELIILDDAFQHRKMKADFNILLTPFNKPFFRDTLVPSGGLRDIKSAALRSDVVMITKSPEHVSHETKRVFQRESGFTLEKDLFFSHLIYKDLRNPETGETVKPKNIDQALLVTGIANPKPLQDWLKDLIPHLKPVAFRDHYHYTEKDFQGLKKIFDSFAQTPDRVFITTEKDYVKLEKHKHQWPSNWTWYVAAINTEINDQMEERFLELIREKVKTKLSSTNDN